MLKSNVWFISEWNTGLHIFLYASLPAPKVKRSLLRYICLEIYGHYLHIFSCSHEKKKMYWEQLELRCRSFYQQQGTTSNSTTGSIRGPPLPPATYCSCCEECRYPPLPTGPQVYPWDHSTDR